MPPKEGLSLDIDNMCFILQSTYHTYNHLTWLFTVFISLVPFSQCWLHMANSKQFKVSTPQRFLLNWFAMEPDHEFVLKVPQVIQFVPSQGWESVQQTIRHMRAGITSVLPDKGSRNDACINTYIRKTNNCFPAATVGPVRVFPCNTLPLSLR